MVCLLRSSFYSDLNVGLWQAPEMLEGRLVDVSELSQITDTATITQVHAEPPTRAAAPQVV
jgi:hypothetical protein